MAKKYAEVVKGLKKIPFELREGGQKYQDRVVEAQQKYSDHAPDVLAREYARIRALKDEAEQAVSAANLELEAVAQLIAEVYEEKGLETQTIKGIGTIRVDPEVFSHVTDKSAYRKWAEENGYSDQFSLHHSTTKSIVNDILLDGHEPPPGIEVYFKQKPVFTREK